MVYLIFFNFMTYYLNNNGDNWLTANQTKRFVYLDSEKHQTKSYLF